MLRSARRGLLAIAVPLAACSPTQGPPIEAVSVEATYRLTFNDNLVGNSLFVLDIGTDGTYRIEAFTTPAGAMEQGDGHEVLETSQGLIGDDGIRPLRFEKSTLAGAELRVDGLRFDWDRRLQHRSGEAGAHTGALLPGTHDRLSYLLTAWRLALAGTGDAPVRIAAPGETDETRLQVTGEEALEVPHGRYRTVAIRRQTPEPNVVRALWFDPAVSPLPLRVVHGWAGNTVDMQLESLSRRPNRPR